MLIFQWKDISGRGRGLTFDDVLLMPSRSDVRSRRDPNLKTKLTKNIELEIPLMSANMDTVTEAPMAIAMAQEGGFGPIHRFMTVEDQVQHVRQVVDAGVTIVGASVGVGEESRARAEALVKAGVNVMVVDIAHGHSIQMLETIKWLKDRFSGLQVIGGNVAMPEAARELAETGADAVKVGIGPGSMCTTRIITGCGVPQLTAIAMCTEALEGTGVPIIGDGGLRTSGDIVKALSAGASTVMLGSMLSGCIETPGEIKGGHKQYRGMASKAAQVSWRGGVPEGMAAEGESRLVGIKGHVRDVVLEICGGIRSGMSYLNATAVSEVREKARFMEMSAAGAQESVAHGLRL
ncbi:MAG: IMP dehydrogenase [Bdellovibrionales bacterium]|jgi:IMP dehydrogenase|nr:IMP dehydrogenase [Bdellovibrionales bacterium]